MNIVYFETDNLTHITSLAMLLKFDFINIHGMFNKDTDEFRFSSYDDILDNDLVSSDILEDYYIPSNHFENCNEIFPEDEYIYLANHSDPLEHIFASFNKKEASYIHSGDNYLKYLMKFIYSEFKEITDTNLNYHYLCTFYIYQNQIYLDIFVGCMFEGVHSYILENYYYKKYQEQPIFEHSRNYYEKHYGKMNLTEKRSGKFKEELQTKYFYDYSFLKLLDDDYYNHLSLTIFPLDLEFTLANMKINKTYLCFEKIGDLIYDVIHYCIMQDYFPDTKNTEIFLPITDIKLLGGLLNE